MLLMRKIVVGRRDGLAKLHIPSSQIGPSEAARNKVFIVQFLIKIVFEGQ